MNPLGAPTLARTYIKSLIVCTISIDNGRAYRTMILRRFSLDAEDLANTIDLDEMTEDSDTYYTAMNVHQAAVLTLRNKLFIDKFL